MLINKRSLLAGSAALGAFMGSGRSRAQGVTPSVFSPVITGKPLEVGEYGNSFTARGTATSPALETGLSGLSPMLEAMSGGQVHIRNPLTQMVGINGQTSTYLLANFLTNVGPMLGTIDALVMWGTCVNDFINGISAATSLANIQAMQALCAQAGKILILGTPYYTRTGSYAPTATQALTMAATNRSVGAWARSTPGVIYFDYWNDIINATQSTTAVSYGTLQDSDNLHPASLGVQVVARRCLASLQSLLSLPFGTMGALDSYDATTNPGGNIFSTLGAGAIALEGTSGTLNSGCTGVLPSYWTATRGSGSDTILCTKTAATSGYGSSGTDQFSVGVSSSAAACVANLNAFPTCPAGIVGQQVEYLMTMTIPNPSTGISDITFAINPNYAYGSLWGLRADLLSAAYWTPGTYLIRTPPLTVATGTTALQISVSLNYLAASTVAVTLSKPVLRLVT